MTARRALVAALALALAACTTASGVATRGRALEERLDPVRRDYCPPEALALGLAEVGFARSASARGDALAASAHLARAEAWADVADAADCHRDPIAPPPKPADPPPPDLDGDGVPDATDPDDDGDGANDIIDQCPTAPEDQDGVEDIDGCPEAI